MKNQRFQYIDSSRGIAAFCVLLHHFVSCYFVQPADGSFAGNLSFLWNGSSPVAYFFVLSGFILSASYFNSEKNIYNLQYGKWAVQRFFRIYPLFFACLGISYVLNAYLHWHGHLPTHPPATQYAAHLWTSDRTMVQLFKEAILIKRIPVHASSRLIPQDWTLTVEIIMSLLIPAMILLLKRGLWWFAIVTFLVFQYDVYILPFAAGVLLARYRFDVDQVYRSISGSQKVMLLLFAFYFYFSGCNLLPLFTESRVISLSFQTLGSTLILGIVLSSGSLQKVLSFKPLVFLGKVSFGLYLTHFFVLLFFVPYFIRFLNSNGVTSPQPVLLLAFVFLVSLSLLLSAGMYYLIELPFIKIGKAITGINNWKIDLVNPRLGIFRFAPIDQKRKD